MRLVTLKGAVDRRIFAYPAIETRDRPYAEALMYFMKNYPTLPDKMPTISMGWCTYGWVKDPYALRPVLLQPMHCWLPDALAAQVEEVVPETWGEVSP
jgi:hypothetical protein